MGMKGLISVCMPVQRKGRGVRWMWRESYCNNNRQRARIFAENEDSDCQGKVALMILEIICDN